jgi:hypothetical protein
MRYYFDLLNGGGMSRDEEGPDQSSPERVRYIVTWTMVDIARDEIPAGRHGSIAVAVRDENDSLILRVCLTFAVEILG